MLALKIWPAIGGQIFSAKAGSGSALEWNSYFLLLSTITRTWAVRLSARPVRPPGISRDGHAGWWPERGRVSLDGMSMSGHDLEAATAENYRSFAEECRDRSPKYEALALAVAGDRVVLAFLEALPPAKRQPNLLRQPVSR
jgi:hypothetical protein